MMPNVRTGLGSVPSWNKADQSRREQRREEKTRLPGKAHRHPRKLRLERRNAEACESCPAALLSECQPVMCHLFRAANSTSASRALCFPAPTKAFIHRKPRADHQGRALEAQTPQIQITLLLLFFMCLLTACVLSFTSAFRSRSSQLYTSLCTAGWLGFKELPTSPGQVESS